MQLYTSKQTRKIDNLAIKQKDISGYSLMQDAAEFSLNVLIQEWGKADQVVVFCSKGKNSGDGFLLASYAKEFGLDSLIVLSSPIKDISGVAKKAFEEAKESGVSVVSSNSFNKIKITKNAVIVDALIGTGLKGEVRSSIKKAIQSINKLSLKNTVLSFLLYIQDK